MSELKIIVQEELNSIIEKSPEGWEGTVKAMKDKPGIDNPWALAHWMKNKGWKSHKEAVKEAYLTENPAAMASAAMATVKLKNQQGRTIKGTSALQSKNPAVKKKAVGMFQKLKNKFTKKKDDKKATPKKQSKSDADFYKRQYAGESINEVGFKPTVYHFKRATASTMDELDAELHRKGFRPGGMGWKGKGGVDFNKRTLTMQTSAIPNNNIKLNKIAKKYGGKLIVFNGKKVKGGEVKSFEIESINERSDFRAMKDFMTLASKRKVDYISRYDDSQLQVDIGKKSFLIQVQSLKESVNEKISKEEWAEYPKYARKLKPYMKRLLKVPVKVRVIKQANHNPWIEVRVARFGKDIIPNDFRKRALKVIGGRARDMDNINYGNIRTNSVSLRHDQWVKLLGNKVKV